MAAKKTTKKKAASQRAAAPRRKGAARRSPAKKRLAPGKEARGLGPGDMPLPLDDAGLAALVGEVEAAGGAALAGYREPLSGRPLLFAALPRERVEPTPFQRDLSPTHAKRLAQKIEESGAYLDPIIVVRGTEGGFWTPNGRHRLAAAKVLGLRQITALVSPDEDLAFRILALNTEKAHNLKDRSLEVIRMARELARRHPRAKETEYAAQLEAPELITLGIVYEQAKRFAGSAYRPVLTKVDRFADQSLAQGLKKREGHAARLLQIEAQVAKIVKTLQERGFKSPYLKTYVVARLNPVRFHRAKKGDTKPPMDVAAALTRMSAAARRFDAASVKQGDLALVAAVAPSED